MKFIIFCTIIGVAVGDKLPQAPYPASGWRPQGATLELPSQYGPPQQQQSNVEISQQNLQFVGQIVETTTDFLPSNEYLPPGGVNTDYPQTTDDTLRVQGLPNENRGPGTFNGQQLNTGEISPKNNQYRQQQIRNQQQFGNLRQQPQRTLQQTQQTGKLRQPQPQFQIRAGRIQAQSNANSGQFNPQFVPVQQFQQQQTFSAQQPQTFAVQQPQTYPGQQPQTYPGQQPQTYPGQQPQTFSAQPPQQIPLNQYGPPITQYGPPQPPQQYPSTENNKPESDDDVDSESIADDTNEDNDDNEGPAISVSNANNGQYYILTQDNTLQKVIYMTSQTEDDIRTNGFTAQLRYEPVEPIRDPVYGYDAEGHLVKIYNKK